MIRAALLLALLAAPAQEVVFSWNDRPDRSWAGPEFWANRLQDWRVRDGWLECTAVQPRLGMRTLHLLTARLAEAPGGFWTAVDLELLARQESSPDDCAAGLLLGVGGGEMDPRAAAVVHQWPGRGGGLFLGLRADGRLVFRDFSSPDGFEQLGEPTSFEGRENVTLNLSARPLAQESLLLTLRASAREEDPNSGRKDLGTLAIKIRGSRAVGNVALVSHPGSPAAGETGGRWRFRKVELGGARVRLDPQATFGPVAAAQYTVSRGVLKLTAQMLPIGASEDRTVRLDVLDDGEWRTRAEAEILEPGFTAPFRAEGWDAARDVPYRVVWNGHEYAGTIRRDPVDEDELVLAGMVGNHNNSHAIGGGWGSGPDAPKNDWVDGMWFPHADLTGRVAAHDPDLLFFAGDQVYEGKSPTFADRAHLELDYLYKWYLWCWAWGDLTRRIPSVTIPDDHDVYQGNLWGEGGRAAKAGHDGGYVHPAEFVRMVERTQTSHLPDPFDPTPVEQGIGVYYTSLLLGRVDFAILEDRKFKSGPAGKGLPPTGTARPDHVAVAREDFDPADYDRPDLRLLGERQLAFLRTWAADWRGADVKAVLSQSPFAGLATHHGAGLEYLQADLDSNGWPPSRRDLALRAMRVAFAFHVAGDQHLATLAQHGVESWNDSCWSFALPSVANFYPRAWRPPGAGSVLGEHLDGLGNKVTMHAVANPGAVTGRQPAELFDKVPGYGIVRVNRPERTITFECWPRWAGPGDEPYAGWPRTIAQTDNFVPQPAAWLPELRCEEPGRVVQVLDEESGELVCALRLAGTSWRPRVPAGGATYTVRVGDPEADRWREHRGLRSSPEPTGHLEAGL